MDSSSSNWREKLSSLHIVCKLCHSRIVPIDLVLHSISDSPKSTIAWSHTSPPGSLHQVIPVYHSWTNVEIEALGWAMGTNKCSLLDNPFYPGNPLHDGTPTLETAPSFAESEIWYQGWQKAQGGLISVEDKSKLAAAAPDGFDYLEAQRD